MSRNNVSKFRKLSSIVTLGEQYVPVLHGLPCKHRPFLLSFGRKMAFLVNFGANFRFFRTWPRHAHDSCVVRR